MELTRLPLELLGLIYKHLPNRDIKNLRLASSFFRSTAQLRLDRVFLSANPVNIAVFHAIADHEKFRQAVVEIVWDDALLIKHTNELKNIYEIESDPRYDSDDGGGDDDEGGSERGPRWFQEAYEENRMLFQSSDSQRPDARRRTAKLEALMSPGDCWSHYQMLLQQQDDVRGSGAHIDAFRRGLDRFPALRRVTITPLVHGKLMFHPRYETPMIRAMPQGFNYPLPHGWPTMTNSKVQLKPWESEVEKGKWRGFCIVMRLLAQNISLHHVNEFVVDVAHAMTGVSCHIFDGILDGPNPEYERLSLLVGRPGFRRLDLALLVGQIQYDGWVPLRNGRLRRMLESATDLEHFHLRTDAEEFLKEDRFVSLHSMFPIAKWTRLKHFGLSGFMVRQADLLSILVIMPETLEEINLSFLAWLDEEPEEAKVRGNWRDLVIEIKTTLRWDQRTIKPRFTIGLNDPNHYEGRGVWVADEVDAFLYGDGLNPFGRDGLSGNSVPFGVGTAKDDFDETYEQPYVNFDTSVKLGFRRKLSWTGYTGRSN